MNNKKKPSPDFFSWLKSIEQKYSDAIKELAKK